MGDDAGIEAGSSHKKKLEYPVSIDEPRYELRQRQTLIPLRIFLGARRNPCLPQTGIHKTGILTLTLTIDFYFLPTYKLPQNFMEFYKDGGGIVMPH
jgi:hypothetical protein